MMPQLSSNVCGCRREATIIFCEACGRFSRLPKTTVGSQKKLSCSRVLLRARVREIVEKGKFHGRFLPSEYFALQKCATQRNAACNIHAGCSEPRRCNSVRGDRMRAASKRNSFFREPAAVGAGDTPKLTAWLLIAGFQRFQLSVFRRFLRAINR